jgi:hypothetical protein
MRTVSILTFRWIKSVTTDEIEGFMLSELDSIPRECDAAMPDCPWSSDMREVDTEFLGHLSVQGGKRDFSSFDAAPGGNPPTLT